MTSPRKSLQSPSASVPSPSSVVAEPHVDMNMAGEEGPGGGGGVGRSLLRGTGGVGGATLLGLDRQQAAVQGVGSLSLVNGSLAIRHR